MSVNRSSAAFIWVGGGGKTVLGLREKPHWVAERNAGDQIITQHFAFEIELADLANAVAGIKQRGIELLLKPSRWSG
jgi:hypothetical protein